MIPKKELSFFKRFLKEKGLYHAFLKDVRHSEKYGKDNLHKVIRTKKNGGTTCIIMDCILWVESHFRLWHEMYTEYTNYYINNYNKNE